MKKIILFLLITIPIFSFAQTEKATWDYPVKPGSKEWKTFKSSEEMVMACQIPEHILNSISTEDLLDLCLKYPMFLDIHFSNNLQDGLDIIIPSFNGFVELFNREDCHEVLMNMYIKETPCDVQLKKNNNTLKLFYLELLISQDKIITKLDNDQKKNILKESLKKINNKRIKNHSQYYELGSALILSRLINSFDIKNKITSDLLLDRFSHKGILIDSINISKIINISQAYLRDHE